MTVDMGKLREKFGYKAGRTSNHAEFIYKFEGSEPEWAASVCHARLRHGAPVEAFITYPNHKQWGNGEKDEYFMDWLLNRSTWASVFLSKDYKDGLEMDLKCANNFTMGGVVATRVPHEFPAVVAYWYDLRKYMDEALAFICAWFFNSRYGLVYFGEAIGNTWHHSFDCYEVLIEDIQNFVDGTTGNADNQPFEANGHYTPIAAVYSSGGDEEGGVCEDSVLVYLEDTKYPDTVTGEDDWGDMYTLRGFKSFETAATVLLKKLEELGYDNGE